MKGSSQGVFDHPEDYPYHQEIRRRFNLRTINISRSLALLIAFALVLPFASVSAERITCPNGIVQYLPCSPEQRKAERIAGKSMTIARPRPQTARAPHNTAKVLKKSFRQLSSSLGRWDGYVSGRGKVHLQLVLLKQGRILASRYIGSVFQKYKEKPTKFTFKSSLPTEHGWSWKIIAQSA